MTRLIIGKRLDRSGHWVAKTTADLSNQTQTLMAGISNQGHRRSVKY